MERERVMELVVAGFVAGAELRPPRRTKAGYRLLLQGGAEIKVGIADNAVYEGRLVTSSGESRVYSTGDPVRLAYVLRMLYRMAAREPQSV